MRRTVLAITGLVLLGGVAGCGQSSLHSKGLEITSNANPVPAAATAPVTNQPPTTSNRPAPPPAFRTVSDLVAAVRGQMAAKRSARFVSSTVGGSPENGLLAWDGTNLGIDHSATQPGVDGRKPVTNHRVLLSGVLYQEVVPGLLSYRTPAGKPWLKITPDDPSPRAQDRLHEAQELTRSVLPTKELADLAPAATITGSQPASATGKPATRYDITVDVARALKVVTIPELKAALGTAQHTKHLGQLHYQLWVGPDRLPLRIAAELPQPDGSTIHRSTDYLTWGQHLPINAPGPAETCLPKDLRPA